MTWPDGIALAVGLTALTLITLHQHHSTTAQPGPREHGHDPDPHHQHQTDGEQDHHQNGHEEDHRP